MTQKEYKAKLTVATRPGATLDEFLVYFQAFEKRRGVVNVTLMPSILKDAAKDDPRAYAELAALNYLLMDREVLSEGRTGDQALITVSCKALKELKILEGLPPAPLRQLLNDARDKKYIRGTKLPLTQYIQLKRHAGGFLSRYGAADVAVEGDARWIDPVACGKLRYELEVDGPIAGTADMSGVGKVNVTAHAFERFRSRGNNAAPEVVWKAMLSELRNPSLVAVPFPPEVMERKLEKYREVGTSYFNKDSGWRFHVVKNNDTFVVVTSYYRT